MRKSEWTESRVQGLSRYRDPDSKHRCDDEYKKRRHRDKPGQERIPPSWRSSSPSSSSSLDKLLDSRQAAESRPRPKPSSVIYHAKSRKPSRSRSYSSHDRSRSNKRGLSTIKNKAPKLVKGMHPKISLIWRLEYRGWKVSLSKLPLIRGFSTMFHWMLNLDQAASLRGLGLH